jgi:hypothetical protein
MRSGRTNDLARRQLEHARNADLSHLRFEEVYRTDVYAEQRGLEQLLHDTYNPPLNRIRGIVGFGQEVRNSFGQVGTT